MTATFPPELPGKVDHRSFSKTLMSLTRLPALITVFWAQHLPSANKALGSIPAAGKKITNPFICSVFCLGVKLCLSSLEPEAVAY